MKVGTLFLLILTFGGFSAHAADDDTKAATELGILLDQMTLVGTKIDAVNPATFLSALPQTQVMELEDLVYSIEPSAAQRRGLELLEIIAGLPDRVDSMVEKGHADVESALNDEELKIKRFFGSHPSADQIEAAAPTFKIEIAALSEQAQKSNESITASASRLMKDVILDISDTTELLKDKIAEEQGPALGAAGPGF